MAEPVVLVVDDNREFLYVLAAVLEQDTPAFRVHGVESGGEALAWLEAPGSEPAFVVLDYHLPDMKAPDVLRRLRRLPQRGTLPVLVLTQVPWPEDAAAALDAGADEFDVKPSRVAPLGAIVRRFWAART